MKRLTLAALVWRVALVNATKDIGKIIKPLMDIIKILPSNKLGPSGVVSVINKPTHPASKDPSPFIPNSGIASFPRSRTKLNPSDAAAVSPQIAPIRVLPAGAAITLSPSDTAMMMPIKQKMIAIQLALLIASDKKVSEKSAAKMGAQAIVINTIATEDSAIP